MTEERQQDNESILRLTVSTWRPSTPATQPSGPDTCQHCGGMGLGVVTIEGEDYQIFCECRLREWEWDSKRHWAQLSSIPVGVQLPRLGDMKTWHPPGQKERWMSFAPAISHAVNLISSPVDSPWLTIMGGVGTGKTMLLMSIYRHISPYCVYLGAGDLTSKIFESFGGEGQTEELTAELVRVPVLLLDDFGVDTANKTIQNKIMQIVDMRYRYRRFRPTVVATNLSRDLLSKNNARVASRILDEDLAKVVSITLPDYRRRSEVSTQTVVKRS